MGLAHEGHVGRAVVAAAGERLFVMELEVVALGAAAPAFVPVGAAAAVAVVDDPPHRGRDVA